VSRPNKLNSIREAIEVLRLAKQRHGWGPAVSAEWLEWKMLHRIDWGEAEKRKEDFIWDEIIREIERIGVEQVETELLGGGTVREVRPTGDVRYLQSTAPDPLREEVLKLVDCLRHLRGEAEDRASVRACVEVLKDCIRIVNDMKDRLAVKASEFTLRAFQRIADALNRLGRHAEEWLMENASLQLRYASRLAKAALSVHVTVFKRIIETALSKLEVLAQKFDEKGLPEIEERVYDLYDLVLTASIGWWGRVEEAKLQLEEALKGLGELWEPAREGRLEELLRGAIEAVSDALKVVDYFSSDKRALTERDFILGFESLVRKLREKFKASGAPAGVAPLIHFVAYLPRSLRDDPRKVADNLQEVKTKLEEAKANLPDDERSALDEYIEIIQEMIDHLRGWEEFAGGG
jgi:hypothetical protein